MKRFRFKIDLRQLPKGQKKGKFDAFRASDGLQDVAGDTSKWAAQQRQIENLPKVTGTTHPWPDQILADELVEAYNVTLGRAQEIEIGSYERNTIFHNVFFSASGSKHAVTRPMRSPHQRISELIAAADGQLFKIAYERAFGPEQNLDDLFESGLYHIDEDSPILTRWPGYRLFFTHFQVKGDLLDEVMEVMLQWDPHTRGVKVSDPRFPD